MRKKISFILASIFFLIKITFCQDITFYKDIQPIMYKKCASCHHQGESAPFSLLTYDDLAKRKSFIKEVVQSRYMPPWKPDNKYVHFANDRSLSQTEINQIVKWVDADAPEGKPVKNAIPLKQPVDGTMFGRKPDLVLKVKDSFLVKGDGEERFVLFKIPFELADSFNVEAIEFNSNNKKLIHHANYAVHSVPDTSININKTEDLINLSEDDRTKIDQYKIYKKTITYYGGWIPGSMYESYPGHIGWVMPKRGVILLTVHFAPSSIDQQSINGINLFFKKEKIERRIKVISFGSGGIGERDITPPLEVKANTVQKFSLDLINPSSAFSIMYVWPHMHYLGKDFKAYLILPNSNDTVKLVHIPDWDFRWQEIYKMKKFVKAPKGSIIHIEGVYDNTAQNPFNPRIPPKTAYSSGDMYSLNEMLTLLMVFLPYEPGDENISLEN